MNPTSFEIALALIDAENANDPNIIIANDLNFPKELLYAQRMSRRLLQFDNKASEALQIAARAQHICRWKIERNTFPLNRVGYLAWRETLKKFHIETTSKILKQVGYHETFIMQVSHLMGKKFLKKNPESQTLEDVVCLVFLEFYFEAFMVKHAEEKVVDIVRKTWHKMSKKGQQAALTLNLSQAALHLVKLAI